MSRFKDLSGQRFGRLVVLDKYIKVKGKNTKWLCRCDCGTEKYIINTNLIKGVTTSCGCLQKDRPNGLIHGMCGTHFYKKWVRMKDRCLNKKSKLYKQYVSRGITVCDKWLDFIGFKGDMYQSYLEHVREYEERDTTFDRIDVNGNYEKSNCRWATWKQARYNIL